MNIHRLINNSNPLSDVLGYINLKGQIFVRIYFVKSVSNGPFLQIKHDKLLNGPHLKSLFGMDWPGA